MLGKSVTARRHVDRWLLLLAACVLSLVCLIYGRFLFGDQLFIFSRVGSDTYYQYWPLDRYFGEVLRGGHFTNWTFRSGLGKQVFLWPSYLNPFMLLIESLPPAAQPGGYVFKMILECGCAVFLWRRYLASLGMSGWVAVVFPLLFGFNGYLVLWGQHTSFGVVFSLIPLTLWAYEHLLQRRRWWPLALSLTLFLVTSFYFFVMFSVFFAVFAATRAVVVRGPEIRSLLGVYARLGLCYLSALALSAWTTLPTLAYLSTSPRIAGQEHAGLFSLFPLAEYAGLLRIYSNNVFGIDIGYRGPINYYEMPQLACGLLPLLLLPQFFRVAPRRERQWATVALGLAFVSLINPFVARIFVAFTAPTYRHSFIWIVCCLYLAARVFQWLENGGELHRGLIAGTAAVLCLPPALAVAAASGIRAGVIALPAGIAAQGLAMMQAVRPGSSAADFARALTEELMPVLTAEMGKVLLGLLAYTAVLLLLPRRRRLGFPVLLGLTVVELLVFNYPTVNQRVTLPKDYLRGSEGYFDASLGALRTLRETDASWYRVDKTYRSVFINDPLFQGYFGASGYDSVIEPATLGFFQAMGVPTYEGRGPNYINGFGDRDLLNSLAGVKYLLSKESLARAGYRQLGTVGDVRIHVNERALPLGFVQHRSIDPLEFATLSPRRKDLALLQGFVPGESLQAQPTLLAGHTRGRVGFGPAEPDDNAFEQGYREAVEELRREPFVISSFQEDLIRGRVAAQEAGVLFLSIPFNGGWRATIDGQAAPVHRIDSGFIGVPLSKGSHAVELRFIPEGSRLGLTVSLLAAVAGLALVLLAPRSKLPE